MATYTFKSSGKTTQNTIDESKKITFIPIGIKTPLRLGTKSGILDMNYSFLDQITDNLQNLLLTNYGERLALYNFGANLRALTSELTNESDFDSAAMENITSAVSTWMPYVNLIDYSSATSYSDNTNSNSLSHRDITVTFSVPSISGTERKLKVRLYLI